MAKAHFLPPCHVQVLGGYTPSWYPGLLSAWDGLQRQPCRKHLGALVLECNGAHSENISKLLPASLPDP